MQEAFSKFLHKTDTKNLQTFAVTVYNKDMNF